MGPLDGAAAVRHNPYLTGRAEISPQPPAGNEKDVKVAEDFEAVFLTTVFNRMFASLETDGLFGGGEAEKTWRSFLAEQYAGEVARQGGIGIADAVRSELVALQEASQR